MFSDNKASSFRIKQKDCLDLSKTNKKTDIKFKFPYMKYSKRKQSAVTEHLQSIKHLTADHKVEFFIEKGHHIMNRSMFKGREIRRRLCKIAGYAAATAVAAILVVETMSTLDVRLGKEVLVNGTPVGFVSNVSAAERVLVDIESLTVTSAAGSNNIEDLDVEYVARLVSEDDITPDFELKQNILAECASMIEAYALYVDGNVVAAASDEQAVFDALDAVKAEFYEADKEMVMSFDKDVSVRKEYVSTTLLHDTDALVSIIKGDGKAVETYIASEGDSLWDIADKYNMTHKQISELNDDISPELKADQKVKFIRTEPLVRVKSEYMLSDIEEIPYTVETLKTNTLAADRKIYTQAGRNGTKTSIVNVISYNGVEERREVIADGGTVEPENRYILIGTNKFKQSTYEQLGKATGTYIKPHNSICTSHFGSRSFDFHTGVDFNAATGTEVLAADGGVVTFAGPKGTYGYLVIIDHGNGVETYYAHNSQCIVTQGEKVAQGEVIAKSGSTGKSTGPHIHFELRINGEPVNPLPYLE